MGNLNVFLDMEFTDLFREIKFILKAKTNKEVTEKIIEVAYKEIKEEKSE